MASRSPRRFGSTAMFRHAGRPTLGATLLAALAVLAHAQTAPNHLEMQARLNAAQAAAARPGDAELDCDRLESQLVAAARDPSVQSFVAKSGTEAKEKMDAVTAASGRAATQAALTIMSSVVPGGAMAGLAGIAAQGTAQRADAARNVQQNAQQAQELMLVLPQMMRGLRLLELAQARQCEWFK